MIENEIERKLTGVKEKPAFLKSVAGNFEEKLSHAHGSWKIF